jgi:sporulation protein YlmC with PRC-barrel domain
MADRDNLDFLSAGTIKGDKVINNTGEDLGKIEELMIDLENGRVAYAALSFGGFLGMGDKLFAIPWDALSPRPHEHAFLLSIPKETLEKAEGFDKDNWPLTTHKELSRTYTYYGYRPYWQPTAEQTRVSQEAESERIARKETVEGRSKVDFLSASAIKGDKVVNTKKEDLGKIEELMIDVQEGRIAYAVLSFGGFLGLGSKLFAIPWQALSPMPDEHLFVLDISKETLEKAEGFDKDHWPVTNREWLATMYSFYGYEPYWQTRRIENRPGNI